MNQGILLKILEAGAQAPSGSNSQPWKFKIKDNRIEILALPERDHPILNFRNRGTWVAHGALIENLAIAASAYGYKADVELCPLSPDCRITAKLTLTQDRTQTKDELFDAIFTRATNRKTYAEMPLSKEQRDKLIDQGNKFEVGEFRLVEDKNKMRAISRASSVNEIVNLENQELHELFFKEIVWTEKEEKEKRTGLYLKTMELQPLQENALQLFKNWPVMRFVNALGMAKSVAKTNEKAFAKNSAIGAVIIKNEDNEFLTAGRIMERVWLQAAKMGLSCHLLTGTLYLWQRLNGGGMDLFSKKHQRLINWAYSDIAEAVGLAGTDKTMALLMRIGNGGQPSGLSSRFPVKNITEITS